MQERIVACWPGLETAFFKDETADSARKSLAGRAKETMPPAWRNDRRETPNRAPGAASVESDCIPIVSLPGPRPKNDASAMMHILSAGNPCVKSGCKSGGFPPILSKISESRELLMGLGSSKKAQGASTSNGNEVRRDIDSRETLRVRIRAVFNLFEFKRMMKSRHSTRRRPPSGDLIDSPQSRI